MSRTFLEIFSRYTPSNENAEILLSADPSSITLRADKPQKLLEASAAFPHVIPKLKLYQIEEEVRAAYELNMVRIRPIYPAYLWNQDRIPDLLMETNRRGIVANGFFNHCEYHLSNGKRYGSDTTKTK